MGWVVWWVWMLWCGDPVDEAMGERRYLDASRQLRAQVAREFDPVLVRRYAVCLIDFHVFHMGFRSFFMKNMPAGVSVFDERGRRESVVTDANMNMVEQNLEALLVSARKHHPESPDLDFAEAYFLHMGGRAIVDSVIEIPEEQCLRVFDEALERGVCTGRTLLALADHPAHAEERGELLGKACALRPLDPVIVDAWSGFLLDQERYQEAAQLAGEVFDRTRRKSRKVVALYVGARAQLGLGHCDQALKLVEHGLTLFPEHLPLWTVGMLCHRRTGNLTAGAELFHKLVDRKPEDPEPFTVYLAFLQTHGISEMDRILMRDYEKEDLGQGLVSSLRFFNLARFYQLDGRHDSVMDFLKRAQAQAEILGPEYEMYKKQLQQALQNAAL